MANYHPANANSTRVSHRKNKQQRFFITAATIGIILLSVISGLAYSYINKAHQLEQTVQDLQKSNSLHSQQKIQYDQALTNLASPQRIP